MATFSFYDVIATSYSCIDHALPVSSSLTALCQSTCGSVATFTDSLSATTSVCISPSTSSPHSLMAALPHTLVTAGGSDQVPSVVDVLQCGSLPSSRHLIAGPSCKSTSRVCLSKINSSLVCFLCGGYLIDATTINRCLHSFCRACILRHLKWVNFCPVCKSLLGATHPHKSLRPDRTLQRVVYKVVPGLYKNERERRRRFSAVSRKSEIIHRGHHQKVRPQSDNLAGSWVYSDDENFSVCLRHQLHLNNASVYWTPFPVTDDDDDSSNGSTNQLIGCRFVLCSAVTSMQLIKKFIKLKLNLREQSKVFLFCSGEVLPDDYTLLDIAYIFSWMKTGPLLIDYVILNTVLSGEDVSRLSCAASAAVLTEDGQHVSQRNLVYTSTQTNSREIETECLAFGLNTNQSCFGDVLSDPHQGLHCQDFNDNRSKQDLTESSFSFLPNNLPRGFLPSFSGVVQLHPSSFDASRPLDLGLKDTKANGKNCSKSVPQTLHYSCEAMITGTGGECLQSELSTNQFAQTASHQQQQQLSSYAGEVGRGLAILPETALAASIPHVDSGSCGVGGMYSYGEDSSSSTCGIQLIGVLAQSVDGSFIQIPNSCFLYNRPVISGWHPTSFHDIETDSWSNAGTSNCFIERENASDALQFLLPGMMHPRPKAVADEVTDVTGIGLSAYQYCSANAEGLTNPLGEDFLGRNFQALPTKSLFNADARTEATQGEMLDDIDQSRLQSWGIGASQTLPVSRDGKGNTVGDQAGFCREICNKLNREADEEIAVAEQQCVVRSEGLLPQPLPLQHTDGQHESTHHMLEIYDLSARNVSDDNWVTDRSVSVSTCHVSDDILQDSSCSLSVPSKYIMKAASVESHGTSASEYHVPQTVAHQTQVASCALLSVDQHLEEMTSSHSTLSSSNFPTTFKYPLPTFRCQATSASSDESIPAPPSLFYAEQNDLQCNTETGARCHSEDGGREARWQTAPTERQTDADETGQLLADDQRDKGGQDESLTLSITVSSSGLTTKPMLTDAAKSKRSEQRIERETRPVDDMELLPPHLSYDSDSIVDRSLELTTQS